MSDSPEVSIRKFESLIRDMYYEKDVARGIPGTFMWLMEEVGELSSALRETSQMDQAADPEKYQAKKQNLKLEFADVLAWLTTIANVADIDLDDAIMEKYGAGCPGCHQFGCICDDAEKP